MSDAIALDGGMVRGQADWSIGVAA